MIICQCARNQTHKIIRLLSGFFEKIPKNLIEDSVLESVKKNKKICN